MHLLTCFVEKGQIAAFGSLGTRGKPVTQQSSSIIRKGHPYSHQKFQTRGPLVAKLSVVWNGLWWGETSGMSPLLPLHVRTEWNGLGNVLSCTQALGVFSWFELALLAPLEVLPVRVFSVCEFLWQKLLPKLKILNGIGKTSVESVSGTCWWIATLEILFLKPGKENGPHDMWNQSSLNHSNKCWQQTAPSQTPGWILQAEIR